MVVYSYASAASLEYSFVVYAMLFTLPKFTRLGIGKIPLTVNFTDNVMVRTVRDSWLFRFRGSSESYNCRRH